MVDTDADSTNNESIEVCDLCQLRITSGGRALHMRRQPPTEDDWFKTSSNEVELVEADPSDVVDMVDEAETAIDETAALGVDKQDKQEKVETVVVELENEAETVGDETAALGGEETTALGVNDIVLVLNDRGKIQLWWPGEVVDETNDEWMVRMFRKKETVVKVQRDKVCPFSPGEEHNNSSKIKKEWAEAYAKANDIVSIKGVSGA